MANRQAAQSVRLRLEWKYALSLELTDSGFDFMAGALGVRERAVWRWLAAAEQDEAASAALGERTRYYGRFTVTL
ncbi:hypothetical protein [Streptomyces sp. NPDC001020]